MSRSPISAAVLVVFIAGGVVGGGTAALLLRATPARSHVEEKAPHRTALALTQSTESAAVRSPERRRLAAPTLGTTEAQDDDPGTGAWLADSLAQLEEKYQAMKQRSSALTRETPDAEALFESPAPDQPTQTGIEDALALNEPTLVPPAQTDQPPPTDPALTPPATVATAPAALQNYIAQADITQNTTATTNVTQVNQTLLVGYLPLLVPVPVSSGSTASPAAPTPAPLTVKPWTGLSPWAPIDMSRHHNPWGNSALP